MRTVALAMLFAPSVGATIRHATDATFDDILDERPYALIAFTAPWCGHCQKLEPELETAASTLGYEGATVLKIDATKQRALRKRFNVRAFPEMLIYRRELASFTKYSGQRSASAIVGHIRARARPACPARSSDGADAWIELSAPEAKGPTVLHVLAEEVRDPAEADGIVTLETLERAMEHMRHVVVCATVAAAPASGSLPMSKLVRVRFARAFSGRMTGRSGAVPPVLRYAGPADETSLLRWLTFHSRPAVSELTESSARMFVGLRDTGVAVLMLPPPLAGRAEAQMKYYERELAEVYAAVSETAGVPCFLTFISSASQLGEQLAGDYEIKPSEPSLIILDFTVRARKPPGYRLAGVFNASAAIEHVRKFKAGELTPPAGWLDWSTAWVEWAITFMLDHWVESTVGIAVVFATLVGGALFFDPGPQANAQDEKGEDENLPSDGEGAPAAAPVSGDQSAGQ